MEQQENILAGSFSAESRVSAAGIALGPILGMSKIRENKYLWDALRNAKIVDFSMNQIRRLDMFERDTATFDGIEMLSLSDNELNDVDCKNIAAFRSLVALNLSHNRLKTIHNISHLPRLKVLDLANNQMTSLRCFRNLDLTRQLERLDVSYNKMLTRTSIAEICQMENLQVLNIQNNLFYLDLQMEAFCILACPNLTELNGQPVTNSVRSEVESWVTQTAEGKEVLSFVRECIIALEARGNAHLQRLEDSEAGALSSLDKEGETLRRAVEAATPHTKSPVLLAQGELQAIEHRMAGVSTRIMSPAGVIIHSGPGSANHNASNNGAVLDGDDAAQADEARAAYEVSARRAIGTQRTHLLLQWFSSLARHRPSAALPVPQRLYEPLKLSTLKSWAKFKNASMSAWKREMDFRAASIRGYREKLAAIRKAGVDCATENANHFEQYLRTIEEQERAHLAFKATGGELTRAAAAVAANNSARSNNPSKTRTVVDENGEILIARNDGRPEAVSQVALDDPVLLERSRRVSTSMMLNELTQQQADVEATHDWTDGMVGYIPPPTIRSRKSGKSQAAVDALFSDDEDDDGYPSDEEATTNAQSGRGQSSKINTGYFDNTSPKTAVDLRAEDDEDDDDEDKYVTANSRSLYGGESPSKGKRIVKKKVVKGRSASGSPGARLKSRSPQGGNYDPFYTDPIPVNEPYKTARSPDGKNARAQPVSMHARTGARPYEPVRVGNVMNHDMLANPTSMMGRSHGATLGNSLSGNVSPSGARDRTPTRVAGGNSRPVSTNNSRTPPRRM